MIENQNVENPTPETSEDKGKSPLPIALFMLCVGLLLVAINLNSIKTKGKYYPKSFVLGMFAIFYSVAIFIAPGARKIDFVSVRQCGYDMFKGADSWTRVLWILYMIASFVASFFIIINADSWDQVRGVFLIFGAASGIFFAIRHCAAFIKRSTIIDGEDVSDSNAHGFDYFNPSKGFAIFGMILGISISVLAGRSFVKTVLYGESGASGETAHRQELILNNLGEEFPVYFIETKGFVTAIVNLSYKNEEVANLNTVPLRKLVYRVVKNSKYKDKHKYFSGLSHLVIMDGEEFIEYSGRQLKGMKVVREMMKAADDSFKPGFKSGSAGKFIEENLNSPVIYSKPEFNNEYCMVWSIHEFTEFFNAKRNAEGDSKLKDEEMLHGFLRGQFEGTVYNIVSFKDFLETVCDESSDLQGVLWDFGGNNQCFIHRSSLKDQYGKALENAESAPAEEEK